MSLDIEKNMVIIGAGTFGLVTVLDRAEHLPTIDAASTDMNKVVHSCYGDQEYMWLARQAIEEWRKDMWQNCYHESVCGILNLGNAYTEQSINNDLKHGANVEHLSNAASIRAQFPLDLHDSGKLGTFTSLDVASTGYINHDGGWAEAEHAVDLLMEHVKKCGVKVLPGKPVQELVKDECGQTKGVHCPDGSEYEASVVVLAVGSWTASAFPSLKMTGKCLATGQCIVTIQLTPEEAENIASHPSYSISGPGSPTHRNVVKFSIHAAGYVCTVPGSTISTPRTIISHPDNGLCVPRSDLKELRVEQF
ncbi:hypothetical protein DFH29DRAFT_1024052 [Suillus ampliporus]|nr:hypothetical protein DFH29DRAFT_1024052 [Suillus ampliporus]